MAGAYKVVIRGFVSRDALLKANRTLRDAGYAFDKSGDTLVFAGLNSEIEANAIATQLGSFSGFKEVRVER